MDHASEALPSLAMHGIGLSVIREEHDCVFEVEGNAGQLAILRRLLDICQHELGMHFEKDSYIPQIVADPLQTDVSVGKEIKIAIVEPATPSRPILLSHYVNENFRGNEFKAYIYSDIVKDRIRKNDRKIRVEIREITTQNFPWEQMKDYLANADMIILAANATEQGGDSLEAIKVAFNKIVQYFPYPEVPLLFAGVRFERGKSPRRETIEAFAESLGVPYVECFKNREMRVSQIIDMALNSVIYKKMPMYKFRAVCKNVKPDVFVNPDFYRTLNQKIGESFPRLLLPPDRSHVDLYQRVREYLEVHEQYAVLLGFHIEHSKSKIIFLQNAARLYLLQLSKSALANAVFDKLKQELENSLVEAKSIVKTLNAARAIILVPIYSLILSVDPANLHIMCELLHDNKTFINLTLVFKSMMSAEMLDKLGTVLMTCSALRSLKFVMQADVRIKEYISFREICASHPTLVSLDFNDCRLSPANVVEIVESVLCNAKLQKLNLSGNYVKDEAICAVKYLLQKNRQLHQLTVSNSQLGLSTLSRVLSGMVTSTSLTELDISRNRLSELGVVYLLKGLSKNPQLTILNVSFCYFSFAAMDTFLIGLQKIDSVISLGLAGNFSRPAQEGLVKILRLLQVNKRLKKIDMSQNPFLDDGIELIADFIGQNRTLEYLDISQTQMTDFGLMALSAVLPTNPVLQELLMRKNKYTSVGVSTLLFSLSKNSGLYSLDIGESVEGKETLANLMAFIPDNTRLRSLGFMPEQKKRTVELLALYENAFLGNSIITSTHQDFSCRCGRCLCVKAKQIVSRVEDNQLNRYKSMALLIKAYFNPAEDQLTMMVFKRIPKDVLLSIFKMAYPEIPQKVFMSVSSCLFFKSPKTIVEDGLKISKCIKFC